MQHMHNGHAIHSGMGVCLPYLLHVYDVAAQFPLMYLCWFVASVLSVMILFIVMYGGVYI